MEVRFTAKSEVLAAKKRILIISDKLGPSYYLACHLPFLAMQKELPFSFYSWDSRVIDDHERNSQFDQVLEVIKNLKPQVVIFCRVQNAWALKISEFVKELDAKTVYFLDDNFFSLPQSTDSEVNSRLAELSRSVLNVKALLAAVDFVWCSTAHLEKEVQHSLPGIHFLSLPYPSYFCEGWSSQKIKSLIKKQNLTIGYYGSFLHRDDLALIVPELQRLLQMNRNLQIEVFGNLSVPDALSSFAGRVRHKKPVKNYLQFLKELKNAEWVLSLAPLRNNEFNLSRSPIKFFESTAAGIPFISNATDVYAKYVSSASGVMTSDAGWFDQISLLLENGNQLVQQLENAHHYCLEFQGIERTIQRYMDVFGEMMSLRRDGNGASLRHQVLRFLGF